MAWPCIGARAAHSWSSMELAPTALVLLGLLAGRVDLWRRLAGACAPAASARQARAARSKRAPAGADDRRFARGAAAGARGRTDRGARPACRLARARQPAGLPQRAFGRRSAEIGLSEFEIGELTEAVRRTQKTAAPFRMVVTPRGSRAQPGAARAACRPAVSPGGAALVWCVRLLRQPERADPAARARPRGRATISPRWSG